MEYKLATTTSVVVAGYDAIGMDDSPLGVGSRSRTMIKDSQCNDAIGMDGSPLGLGSCMDGSPLGLGSCSRTMIIDSQCNDAIGMDYSPLGVGSCSRTMIIDSQCNDVVGDVCLIPCGANTSFADKLLVSLQGGGSAAIFYNHVSESLNRTFFGALVVTISHAGAGTVLNNKRRN